MLLKSFMMLMMLNFCEGRMNTAGEEDKRREGFASEETTTNPQETNSLKEHINTKADNTTKSLLKRQILGIWMGKQRNDRSMDDMTQEHKDVKEAVQNLEKLLEGRYHFF